MKNDCVPRKRPVDSVLVLAAGAAACLFLLSPDVRAAAGGTAAVAATTVSSHHKIQTSDSSVAAAITAQGGHLIADYGGYQLYDAPAIPDSTGGAPFEVRDAYNQILLHARHLDTTKTEVKAMSKAVGAFSGRRMHLVHFAGPIQAGWREELEAAGVKVVAYVPHNAYLIYGDAAALGAVQKLAANSPHIQWEGAYRDEYKIHPLALPVDEKGNPRSIGTDLFAVQLVADAEANASSLQLIDQFKLEPIRKQHAVLDYVNIVVRLPAESLTTLAGQPEVVSIQPYWEPQMADERQDQIVAGSLSGNTLAGPGYFQTLTTNWNFSQSQFNASGFLVDVTDSGIDEGTTAPAHFGLYVGGSKANASRIAYNSIFGTYNTQFPANLMGCDGHGNINAHIIGGYDTQAGFPFADNAGYHYGLGICPFTAMGSSVIFDANSLPAPNAFTYPNYNNLQSTAYHSGARISNNSWGAPGAVSGLYTIDAQNYDALVRDAQPSGSTYNTLGNQEMVIIFAAGNSGTNGTQTIWSPGTAKNVITVGAADNVQPFGGADALGIGDAQATNANSVANFSSRGPCADGRNKPDLMAPGTHVSGGVAQWAAEEASAPVTGVSEPCFNNNALGVAGGVGSIYFPTNQQLYTASSGTSVAAPAVTGGAALLRQYFINRSLTAPSPAMTKAYLMNSARFMTGSNANDTLPSETQGMGELNLGAAFDGTPRILHDEDVAFTASGQTAVYSGKITSTNAPFRVTLAWTDAPGSTTGSAWNNDLDLSVTLNGITYKGNVFQGPYSTNGGSFDVENNVESVILPPGVAGNFVVTVTAANINSVGVPNAGNTNMQDFALVIYNGAAGSVPVIGAGAATLTGEGCSPVNGAVDPGETVTVSFAVTNSGTAATTNLVATLLAAGGVVSPSPAATYGVVAAGSSAAKSFTFTANGACGGNIIATLQLQDGAANLGTLAYNFQLGKAVAFTNKQSFDSVIPPALPTGWSSGISTGTLSNWATEFGVFDSAPLAAFVADSTNAGFNFMFSPVFNINSTAAQLTFRQNYNLEASTVYPSIAHDGAALYVQIGTNAFTNIVSAGGSFTTGGYNSVISSAFGNPLGGQSCWSGNSGGWVTATVNLPASAAGQPVQFMWILGTDVGNAYSVTGWYVDSVAVVDYNFACCGSTDLSVSQSVPPTPVSAFQNLTYTITIANLGATDAQGVTMFDTLPSGVQFVSASPGLTYTGASIYSVLGTLPAGTSTNLTFTIIPQSAGTVSNTVSVASSTLDVNSANNTSSLGTTINPYSQVVIDTEPTNQTVLLGGIVSFSVAAEGTAPLIYQWYENVTNALLGATGSTLTLTNVQINQAGNYSVVVSNLANAVTSTVVTLSVLAQPAIITQPSNQTVSSGANATFSVTAVGTPPLSYQWYFAGSPITGALGSSYTVVAAQLGQAGSYFVVITNAAGAITSSVTTLTVNPPPSADLAIFETASLAPAAVGVGLTYTLTLTNYGPLTATNVVVTDTLPSGVTFSNASPGCVYTNGTVICNLASLPTGFATNITIVIVPTVVGNITNNVSISSATLDPYLPNNSTNLASVVTLPSAPTFVQQPANIVVVANQVITLSGTNEVITVTTNASFQAVATSVPPATYQWFFYQTNINTAVNIPGATNSTLVLTNIQLSSVGEYGVVASNISGVSTSAIATLTVILPLTVATAPINQTVVEGVGDDGFGKVYFSIVVGGGSAPTYQWYFNGTTMLSSGNKWWMDPAPPPGVAPISTVTNATLQINFVDFQDAGTYEVIVTSIVPGAGTANAVASLKVLPNQTDLDRSISGFKLQSGAFSITLSSVAGVNYTLEYKTSLTGGTWTQLPVSTVTGTGNPITLQDANPTGASRFYRIICN